MIIIHIKNSKAHNYVNEMFVFVYVLLFRAQSYTMNIVVLYKMENKIDVFWGNNNNIKQ